MKKSSLLILGLCLAFVMILISSAWSAPTKTYSSSKDCVFKNLRIWHEHDYSLASINLNWQGYAIPVEEIPGSVLKVEVFAADSERGKFIPILNATTRLKKKYEGYNQLDLVCYGVDIPISRLPYKKTFLKVKTRVNYKGRWLIPYEKMIGAISKN